MSNLKKVILLLFIVSRSSAQSFSDSESCALLHSNLSNSNSALNTFNNPANLMLNNDLTFTAFYSPAPYGLSELAIRATGISYTSKYGAFAAGFHHYGFELYKEQRYAFSYANCIAKNFYMGISAIYYNVSIKNYGTTGTFYFNLGLNYRILESIRIACLIINPTRASLSGYSNELPVVLKMGADIEINNSFTFCTALAKEGNFDTAYSFGLISHIFSFINLYTGYRNYPSSYSCGITLYHFQAAITYSIYSHEYLGLSQQIGCQINL